MSEFIEKQWKEINSRNPISGDNFATGLKDFKFSVGAGYGFIPNLSYFRAELKATIGVADGAGGVRRDPLVRTDFVAFAEGCVGNMFNNIYFNMGGQTVSSMTSNVGQCEMLKNRLTKTKAHNDSVGKVMGFDPHFMSRLINLTSNVAEQYDDVNSRSTQDRGTKMFIWKPAIGIFDVPVPLGSGEYDIQLNPSQDYKTAALQSTAPTVIGTGIGQINLEVIQFRFYACMVRTNIDSTGGETLYLHEMAPHTINRSLTGPGVSADINDEVSVPSSTTAISLFLQDAQAGKTTVCPPSLFTLVGGQSDLKLKSYQIQYANMIKPTVRYSSEHNANVDTLQQRYLNCVLETGQFFNPGGFESYENYLERGVLLHESFLKASDNLATTAHIVADYSEILSDARLFVVATYTTKVIVKRQHGLIVDIKYQTI